MLSLRSLLRCSTSQWDSIVCRQIAVHIERPYKASNETDAFKRRALIMLGSESSEEKKVRRYLDPHKSLPSSTPRLYVGNVDNSISLAELKELCSNVTGESDAILQMIRLKQPGQTTPFIKVYFKSDIAQKLVLDKLNGFKVKGKVLVVRRDIANYCQLHLTNIDVSLTIDEIKLKCQGVLHPNDPHFIKVSRMLLPSGNFFSF